ncbi:MAG: hypothetical protein LBH69_01340 [Methanomassiliicoccaceae archaeon]|jgi:hypothetical protein|nr:hypothetical protein [Methanomassiliicoccaceae archaeon]
MIIWRDRSEYVCMRGSQRRDAERDANASKRICDEMVYYEIIDGHRTLHYQQADYLRFVREYHKLTSKHGYRTDEVRITNRGVQVHVSSFPQNSDSSPVADAKEQTINDAMCGAEDDQDPL